MFVAFSVVLPPKYASTTAIITFSNVSFHVVPMLKGMESTLSSIPAKLNTTIHHTKTNGRTFFESQESEAASAFQRVLIASISLFCWSKINCCNLIFSSVGISALVISAIASFGDVTPDNTLPKAGFITEAAPSKSLPTVLSLNFF